MSFAKSTTINYAAFALTKLAYGVKIYEAIALTSKIAFFAILSKDRLLLLNTKHSSAYYM
jgi:hypothetical protein